MRLDCVRGLDPARALDLAVGHLDGVLVGPHAGASSKYLSSTCSLSYSKVSRLSWMACRIVWSRFAGSSAAAARSSSMAAPMASRKMLLASLTHMAFSYVMRHPATPHSYSCQAQTSRWTLPKNSSCLSFDPPDLSYQFSQTSIQVQPVHQVSHDELVDAAGRVSPNTVIPAT